MSSILGTRWRGWLGVAGAMLAVLVAIPQVHGQAADRAVFVANNGNLEGSVTAFRVNGDGTLTFANRIITGSRPNTSVPCPGCNAYEISLTPNGEYLATGHATGPDPNEQVTVFSVGSDATITQVAAFLIPGTPMDVQWIDDELLAVTRTDPSPNKVVVYRFSPGPPPTLTQVDIKDVGGFACYLARSPGGEYLYVSNSGTGADLWAFRVDSNGQMTLLETESTGSAYALEITLSHDGKLMYAAGGITHVLPGYAVDADGFLSPLAGSPFPEWGSSPSNVAVSGDDGYLLVGHGTDATVRSAAIDPSTGMLSPTPYSFDVGTQGTLGDVQALEDLFFVSDNSTLDGQMGVYSFTLNGNGSFTLNAPIYTTEGIAPRAIATWAPPPQICHGDCNCDGQVGFQDIDLFVAGIPNNQAGWTAKYLLYYGVAPPPGCWDNCDVNGIGTHCGFDDIDLFVSLIPSACP